MNHEQTKSNVTVSPALQDEQVLHWLKEAERVAPKMRLDVAVGVLLEDTTRLATSARQLWEPTEARAGLKNAGVRVPADLPDQIASLGAALQRVHDAVESAIDQRADARGLWEQGHLRLMELRSVMAWTAEALSLDSPLHDVWRFDEEPADIHALGEEMEAIIQTMGAHRETVHSVASFDEELVAQTRSMILKIEQLQANIASERPSMRALLVARRRLALLLQDRLRLLFSAARYVFRGQPSLLAEMQGEVPELDAIDPRRSVTKSVSRRYEWRFNRHQRMV